MAKTVVADAEFLRLLRFESSMFSGWSLRNMCGVRVPSWVDVLAARFPARRSDQREWWAWAFKYYISGLPPEYICKAPLVAGEIGTEVRGYCVNPDIVSCQERMAILYRARLLERLHGKTAPLIVEIGAGYGALAYFIKCVVPHCTYCIVDLPSSLKFSGCYLSLAQNKFEVSVGRIEQGSFSLLPAGAIQGLRDSLSDVELFINTLSFAEMPSETVRDYARLIAATLVDDGVLFEQNFDNGHYRQPTHCNPSASLERYLHLVNTVEGDWHWGRPNVWSTKRTKA